MKHQLAAEAELARGERIGPGRGGILNCGEEGGVDGLNARGRGSRHDQSPGYRQHALANDRAGGQCVVARAEEQRGHPARSFRDGQCVEQSAWRFDAGDDPDAAATPGSWFGCIKPNSDRTHLVGRLDLGKEDRIDPLEREGREIGLVLSARGCVDAHGPFLATEIQRGQRFRDQLARLGLLRWSDPILQVQDDTVGR